MKKRKVLGDVFFVLTLLSPMMALVVAGEVGESEIFSMLGVIRYSWIMWLFIPIGIISFILGLKLRVNNQSYKKNFIIAFICVPAIILFGSFRFIFSDISYSTEKVYAVENVADVEFPDKLKVAREADLFCSISYVKIIDKESREKFIQDIESSPVWTEDLGSKIESILPIDVQFEIKTFDHLLFYNKTTGEYNTYPYDGEYECLAIAYDVELNRMVIVDDFKVVLN